MSAETCKNCPLQKIRMWQALPFSPITADTLPIIATRPIIIDSANCPGPFSTGETEQTFWGRKPVLACRGVRQS